MSVTFNKLFSSITSSTIWVEDPETKVVWITMLAMADKYGRVWASLPGLAKDAVVSIEATKKALGLFMSPDPYSRTKDNDGRRIEEIDGGWRLINHAKYREIRDELDKAERKAKNQAAYRDRNKRSRVTANDNALPSAATVTARDHNAEAEAEAITPKSPLGDSDGFTPGQVAMAVIQEVQAGGISALMTLSGIAKALMDKGEGAEVTRDKMISRWREYSAAMKAQKFVWNYSSIEKFFAGGLWDQPEAWPWKAGAAPQVKRVYAGIER